MQNLLGKEVIKSINENIAIKRKINQYELKKLTATKHAISAGKNQKC